MMVRATCLLCFLSCVDLEQATAFADDLRDATRFEPAIHFAPELDWTPLRAQVLVDDALPIEADEEGRLSLLGQPLDADSLRRELERLRRARTTRNVDVDRRVEAVLWAPPIASAKEIAEQADWLREQGLEVYAAALLPIPELYRRAEYEAFAVELSQIEEPAAKMMRVAEEIDSAIRFCPAMRKLFAALSVADGSQTTELLVTGYPAAASSFLCVVEQSRLERAIAVGLISSRPSAVFPWRPDVRPKKRERWQLTVERLAEASR
ncbi:MAG: hypothetical protein AAFQ65_07185 [Myxococcota bacterium]